MTDKSECRLQPITFLIKQKRTNRNRASYLQPVFNFRPPRSATKGYQWQ